MGGLRIGIVGATGLVGEQLLGQLQAGDLPVGELRLMASSRSAGRSLCFRGTQVPVQEAVPELLAGLDLVFFAAGTTESQRLVPEAVARGATVIDKSNAFRMDPDVPLIVPEVNAEAARRHQGVIASPNCSTIQLVMVLEPLRDHAGLARVIVTTFQSVSGSGRDAMEELERGTRARLSGVEDVPGVYPHPIAFNLIPHIDEFNADGYSLEEEKMRQETRKILDLPSLDVSATCVRVPVLIGHSEAVLVETEQALSPVIARRLLAEAPGVTVVDDPGAARYPTPRDVEGRDEVLVGRIRTDLSGPNGLWLWVVADNLRRGAVTNALNIARLLVTENLVPTVRR